MKLPPPKKKLPPVRPIIGKHVRAVVVDGKYSIVTNLMRMIVGDYLPDTKCSMLTYSEAKLGVAVWDKFIEDNQGRQKAKKSQVGPVGPKKEFDPNYWSKRGFAGNKEKWDLKNL